MMNLNIHIRRADLQDCARITTLYNQLGYNTSQAEMQNRIEALSKLPSDIIYVADKSGAPVIGCIHAGLCQTLAKGEFLCIYGLVVDEAYRNQHIGQLLLEAAEEWSYGQGCQSVRIRSNVIREDAHRFYERLGYQNTKSQYILEKRL